MKALTIVLLSISIFISCGPKKEEPHAVVIDEAKLKKQLEEVQKPAIIQEKDVIDSYVKMHQLQVTTTQSGLRYQIFNSHSNNTPIRSMDEVRVKYKVLLLDGTLCYSSDKTGAKTIKVDMDNVEDGLHEGLKLLHEGEKAVFILPSHLAHGLTGDNNKIPPRSPVLYEIEVLKVTKNK